jgi:hypothetical protein
MILLPIDGPRSPTARDHLAVAALDGGLYAVGGRIDGNYSRI